MCGIAYTGLALFTITALICLHLYVLTQYDEPTHQEPPYQGQQLGLGHEQYEKQQQMGNNGQLRSSLAQLQTCGGMLEFVSLFLVLRHL